MSPVCPDCLRLSRPRGPISQISCPSPVTHPGRQPLNPSSFCQAETQCPAQGEEPSLACSSQVTHSGRDVSPLEEEGMGTKSLSCSLVPGVNMPGWGWGVGVSLRGGASGISIWVSLRHLEVSPQDPAIRPSWSGSETQRGSWAPACTPASGHPRVQVCLGSSCELPIVGTACQGVGSFSFWK